MKTTFGTLSLIGCGLLAIPSVGCASSVRDADGTREARGAANTSEAGGAANTSTSTDGGSAGAGADAGGPNDDAGGPNDDATGPNEDPAAACAEYAVATCHKIATCNSWFIASYFEDEASCVKRLATATNCVGSFALAGTSQTVERLKACTSAKNRSTCAEWLNDDPTALAACIAKSGSLPNGTGCGDDAQCQTGHCRLSDDYDCGVCGPAPGPGDACSGGDGCAAGLICSNLVCAQTKGAGEACNNRADCSNSLACNDGHCASPRSAGENCTEDACDAHAGLYCASGVCRKTQYAAPGQPCGWANGIDCAAGGFCRSTGSASQGTCVAPAKDGESCDDQQGPRCLAWATCTGGYCKLANPAACH